MAYVDGMKADRIAEAVIAAFRALPRKAKPRLYENGRREWTTLAGIVLTRDGHEDDPFVAALGTGMRCLPASKLPVAHGRCLHDWHAEIGAIRAFNAFLLSECRNVIGTNASGSLWLREGHLRFDRPQPFDFRSDVRIAMYISEAPCGDASMELVMKAQKDATPWAPKEADNSTEPTALAGRGDFSKLGIVRRKPARADAPITNSKSCSDKLLMKQCTSLLSSLTSLFISEGWAYLDTLVVPEGQYVAEAVTRNFHNTGRIKPLFEHTHPSLGWFGGYDYRYPTVLTTSRTFDYSRAAVQGDENLKGSNITAVWTPQFFEVLIGGTKSGFKQFSERGASALSRAAMWAQCLELARTLDRLDLTLILDQPTYEDVKQHERLDWRRKVKSDVRGTALQGWIKNGGDDSFGVAETTW